MVSALPEEHRDYSERSEDVFIRPNEVEACIYIQCVILFQSQSWRR